MKKSDVILIIKAVAVILFVALVATFVACYVDLTINNKLPNPTYAEWNFLVDMIKAL